MDAISRGAWFPTNEPIHFDVTGHLRNGQHRLTAIANSGHVLQQLVVRGATEEEIDSIDTGTRRLPGDVLALRHFVADGDTAATALKMLYSVEHGWLPVQGGRNHLKDKNKGMNNHEVGRYFTFHPEIVKSVEYINETPVLRKLLGSRGTMAFCHYSITQKCKSVNSNAGYDFFHALERDIYKDFDDPVYRLRERLTRAKSATPQSKDKLSVTAAAALIIKAWNLWITGRSITRLAWRTNGIIPEAFPTPLAPK